MTPALFEFFEVIAAELCTQGSRVITSADLSSKQEMSSLLEDLKTAFKVSNAEDAMGRAVIELTKHFKERGALLPFTYEATTGRFTPADLEYLQFVTDMASIRSVGKRSRDFECRIAQRLEKRVTGSIHRVGFPRDIKKNKAAFIDHLKKLGFSNSVLMGRDKDGGLDILWALPLGGIPHTPLVSVQCKNGPFNVDQAYVSIGHGSGSLGQHLGLLSSVHVPCVLFNDYVYSDRMTKKQMNFVPLGLTDLAVLEISVGLELI